MSTLQNNPWTNLPTETLNPKYEKCRNITEEIYKRINITFQIKKLETTIQSDSSIYSEQIDSNELSNETDLFACDKSSISSSTELDALENGSAACEKYINNNNNIEESKVKKAAVVYKRPRKRFRKRVKKQTSSKRDSDGSSDEALPLSRVAVVDTRPTKSPLHSFMGVPNVVITPIDYKKLNLPIPEMATKITEAKQITKIEMEPPDDKDVIEKIEISKNDAHKTELSMKDKTSAEHLCTICNLSFRGERGLRRHMTISHISG